MIVSYPPLHQYAHRRANPSDFTRDQLSTDKGERIMAMDITKGSMRVYIDPKRCIANAKCTAAAPGVYTLDEETGVAVIANGDEATVEQLFAGARACPTQAIIIEQFGRRVFPTILTLMFGAAKDNQDTEAE